MKYFLIAAALLAGLIPAFADDYLWQSLRTGMSPSEVKVAFPSARTAEDGTLVIGGPPPHEVVTFSFRDSRLAEVMVGIFTGTAQNTEQVFARRKEEMTGKYGKPIGDVSKTFGKGGFMQCDFVSGETHIELNAFTGPPGFLSSVTEDYKPAETASSAK